jgi:hypothetical protein
MKKTNILSLLVIVLFLALGINTQAQTRQVHIGSQRNEVATKVLVCPDGSGTIIGGYEYDFTAAGTDITNAQMLLLKVDPTGTSIIWQERFGISGTNNLIQDMIITHDGDVVVVGTIGRNSVYSANNAAIMKFSSATGAMLWEGSFHAVPITAGGEEFLGVTELGAAGSFNIVAVGATNATPGGSDALVCVYNPAGTLLYNESYPMNSGDAFIGACTSADGASVYLCGNYVGNYKDARVHMYTPGTTSGTMVWSRYFDFAMTGLSVDANGNVIPGTQHLQDNFFNDIYLAGTELIIHGGSLHNYSTTAGEGENLCRLNANGIAGPTEGLWQIQNSNMTYANTSQVAVVDRDHIYNVQSPSNSWVDPIMWLTGVSNQSIVTDVTTLTPSGSALVPAPVRFTPPGGGIHALFDIRIAGSDLHLAGSTTNSNGFGNNDIYYVVTPTSLPVEQPCNTTDVGGMLAVTWSTPTPPMGHYSITATPVHVLPESIQYRIASLCEGKHPCIDDANLSIISGTDPAGNCIYSVTATVTTVNTILGYDWTLPGGSSVVVHTGASSNTQTFTLTSGTSGTVKVKIHVVQTDWAAGESPCCETEIEEKVSCKKDTVINPCDTPIITVSQVWDPIAGHCVPVYSSSIYPVTVKFMINVTVSSPYATCSLFPAWVTLTGPTVIDPCMIASSDWVAASCVPSTPYPCPLSSPGDAFINFIRAVHVSYGNCNFDIDVPLDPNCGPRPAGGGTGEKKPADTKSTQLSVVPNPTDGVLTLQGTLENLNGKNVKIEVTDILGKTIYTDKYTVNNGDVRKKVVLGNSVPNGVYLIKVSGDNVNQTIRFTLNR